MKADFDQFCDESYVAASKSTSPRGEVIGVNVDGSEKHARRPGAFTSMEPTPFEKSDLAQSAVETEGRQEFFNDRQPFYAIKHQKPEHLVMIYMKAEGQTNKEIADKMGVTAVCVANVLKQPWARKQLADIIHKNGGNEVATLFKSAAAEAAEVLIEEMKNVDSRPSDRISAADKVLDRVFGKASQPIAHTYTNEDLQKLPDTELLKLAQGN